MGIKGDLNLLKKFGSEINLNSFFDSIHYVSGIMGGMMFMYGAFLISNETGCVFVGLFLYYESKYHLMKSSEEDSKTK